MADIAPFGLRMQTELKERLEREAKINGRSLNAEIVDRLKKSIEQPAKGGFKAEQVSGGYTPGVTDIERQLLTIFRRMPVEKQLALLSLFN